jgi:hypothetical protein
MLAMTAIVVVVVIIGILAIHAILRFTITVVSNILIASSVV